MCDMSKVTEFCLEKGIKLYVSAFKYFLFHLVKSLPHVKLGCDELTVWQVDWQLSVCGSVNRLVVEWLCPQLFIICAQFSLSNFACDVKKWLVQFPSFVGETK